MSLKDTQSDLIRQEIILRELQLGRFPSVAFVESEFAKIMDASQLGRPQFQYRPTEKHKASVPHEYNAMLTEIEQDLSLAFEEVRRLNNQLMAEASHYESNRIRIDRQLKLTEMRADSLMKRSISRLNRDVVGDTFHDFSMVDFNGDLSRNIPKTTAFIDLRHTEAHIGKSAQPVRKYDMSQAQASFKTLTPDTRVTHLSPVAGALTDSLQEAWRSVITSTAPDGVVGQLDILAEEVLSVTHVSINMQSAKPIIATLLLSEDGETFVEYESRQVVSSYQWLVEEVKAKYIRFILEKRESDLIDGVQYDYLFGAKSIEVRKEEYVKEAVVVSRPHPLHVHEAFEFVHLEIEEYIPSGTNIRYYVGIDYGDNVIEWHEIQKNRPVDMKMIQSYHLDVDSYTNGYGDFTHASFGHNYYRIAKLPEKPLMKTMQVLMGRHMWLKETLLADVAKEDPVVYQTTMRDWIRAGSALREYMNIDNFQDTLIADRFHRYTTYVYVATGSAKQSAAIKVDEQSSLAVFINSNQLKSISGVYEFQFRPGWNKVELLAYSREAGQEIEINLYLREISDRIYANNQPLQEVSVYDLLHNTSPRLHHRFAVDEENNIIVNYNPKDMDVRRHGIEYTLDFQYSTSSKNQHAIRFMAVLSKEDDTVTATPRLKDYRILIE